MVDWVGLSQDKYRRLCGVGHGFWSRSAHGEESLEETVWAKHFLIMAEVRSETVSIVKMMQCDLDAIENSALMMRKLAQLIRRVVDEERLRNQCKARLDG